MTRKAFSITSIGASHIKHNRICQDYSACKENDGFVCIVVSDGHGGEDYIRSDKGSEFAVKAATECVSDFVSSVKTEQLRVDSNRLFSQLSKSIISCWNDKVWNHYSQVPLSPKEQAELSEKAKQKYIVKQRIEALYGATLILAVVTNEYWFGLHIGDGKCVVKDYNGIFSQPIPWDENCFLNATTSICDSDAFDKFRFCFSETIPAAIFIGSDGIDDCFTNDDQLYNLYDAVIVSFGQCSFDEALEELKDYIPKLSSKGSGDDMSMAGVIDVENIHSYMSHNFDHMDEVDDVTEITEVDSLEVYGDVMLSQDNVVEENSVEADEVSSQDNADVPPPVDAVASRYTLDATITPLDAMSESSPIVSSESKKTQVCTSLACDHMESAAEPVPAKKGDNSVIEQSSLPRSQKFEELEVGSCEDIDDNAPSTQSEEEGQ